MDAPDGGAGGDGEPKPLGQAQLQAKVRALRCEYGLAAHGLDLSVHKSLWLACRHALPCGVDSLGT